MMLARHRSAVNTQSRKANNCELELKVRFLDVDTSPMGTLSQGWRSRITPGRRRAAEAEDLRTLLGAVQSVGRSEDPRAAICATAQELAGAEVAVLWEPDGVGEFRARAWTGLDHMPILEPAPATSGVRRARDTGQRLFVPDTQRVAGLDGTAALRAGCRSLAFEPALLEDRCLAVLAVGWRRPVRRLSEHASTLLAVLAAETALTLDREAMLRRLQALARTDELTGLANRRALTETLRRETHRSRRAGVPLCVAVLDLDGFKGYNDRHGHPAGDRVLAATAAAWQSRLREGDTLARMGGDEFALLLPDSPLCTARGVLDRLRAVTPAGVTCSAGVARLDGTETPDIALNRADTALYAAKAAGGDQVRVAYANSPASWGPTQATASSSSTARATCATSS